MVAWLQYIGWKEGRYSPIWWSAGLLRVVRPNHHIWYMWGSIWCLVKIVMSFVRKWVSSSLWAGVSHCSKCSGVLWWRWQEGHNWLISALGLLPGDTCIGIHLWIIFWIWIRSSIVKQFIVNLMVCHLIWSVVWFGQSNFLVRYL